MPEAKYWIWLQDAVRIGSKTYAAIETFGSAEEIYNQDYDVLRESGLFSREQLLKLKNKALDEAEKKLKLCEENGWKTVTPDSRFYPPQLKEINNYPLVLYVAGDESVLLHNMLIGVVGTRRPSQYGMDVAGTISFNLTKGGAVIVSGGALGIDSVGHRSAMEAGGKTILVMGCGLGHGYLPENKELRMQVAENGALISEYPPFCPPNGYSFILRNRITAGLCRGVLVVEAGKKSGSLSTARKVISYGRDLFVVTGDAKGTNFLGANELVKEGARVIFSADDILTLYGYEIRNRDSFNFGIMSTVEFEGIDSFPNGEQEEKKKRKSKVRKKKNVKEETASDKTEAEEKNESKGQKKEIDFTFLSPEAALVYKAIENGVDTVDEIALKEHIQIRKVLVALTELEMEEAVKCVAGNRYVIN